MRPSSHSLAANAATAATAAIAAALLVLGAPARANPAPDAGAADWKTFDDIRYRLDAQGDLSCYSEDGKHCKLGVPSSDERKWQPLSCGRQHQSAWEGKTGYDQPGHWCNAVHAFHFAEWRPYEILGHDLMLSTNANGDPMCFSFDGVRCVRGKEWQASYKGARISPVVCGKAHLRDHAVTGYDKRASPGHWCQSDEIVMHRLHPEGSLERDPTYAALTFAVDLPKLASETGARILARLQTADWPLFNWAPVSGPVFGARVYFKPDTELLPRNRNGVLMDPNTSEDEDPKDLQGRTPRVPQRMTVELALAEIDNPVRFATGWQTDQLAPLPGAIRGGSSQPSGSWSRFSKVGAHRNQLVLEFWTNAETFAKEWSHHPPKLVEVAMTVPRSAPRIVADDGDGQPRIRPVP